MKKRHLSYGPILWGLGSLCLTASGCEGSLSGSDGIVSIIYAVGDVILAILNAVL
jgi:hypothetical protein